MAKTGSGSDVKKFLDIICDADGKIVGRTRLQKIAYFLDLAGFGGGFSFEYRHYGPYSEDLAIAARNAHSLGLVEEEERPTSWGGSYSIFTANCPALEESSDARRAFAHLAARADPIELELAATAAFFCTRGKDNPWSETAKRKPEKAVENRLERAKNLYEELRKIETPRPLPEISEH